MDKRIQSIDALRGISIIGMVIYHFIYDLAVFGGMPRWILYNTASDMLQLYVCSTFILLAGVSSRFSLSNVKRGIKVLALALIITLVTYLMDNIVIFGILHFLGISMVFYGLTEKLWDRINTKLAPVIYIALFICGRIVTDNLNPVSTEGLWIFGFYTQGFFSSDYFPIIPWLFLFLLGTWLGILVKDRRLPKWFYSINPKVLPAIGRKSILIYMLHQPILYGITMIIGAILK